MLFETEIRNLDDWGKHFQNPALFERLTAEILTRHGLPTGTLERTTPGSHAVFRVGNGIVKIFAPEPVGWNCEEDFLTERFSMSRAKELGVLCPELLAWGRIRDRYEFRYLVMEFAEGTGFGKASLTEEEKRRVGAELRRDCDRMNTPCPPFNSHDVLSEAETEEKWSAFPESFRAERQEFLNGTPFGSLVYVHGDLHEDNVILNPDGRVVLLDFADSVLAPVEYEYAALIPGLFHYERAFLDGFFEAWNPEELADILLRGLMLHRYGAPIIHDSLGAPAAFPTLDSLRQAILEKLSESFR